ncbi:MAG TPA: amidohydrolase family protein [Gemmatimonadaceae bacterium]|nr:amidohydrolase family protein [Gemmatimonadaceae bacterium]
MHLRSLVAPSLALALLATPAAAQSAHRRPPDLLLTGGKVFTADSAHPWAESVAIRGERIVAVGTTAELRRLAGHRTREIALGGRVVIPGINDAHDHIVDVIPGVAFHTSASPTPDDSFAVVRDSLRALVARVPRGTLLEANIGLPVLDDPAARRAAIDSIAPDHPVMLRAWWGHGMVVNTAALRSAGIGEDARDPLGGWFERDSAGLLTGRIDEYAEWGLYRRVFSRATRGSLVAGLRAFGDSSLAMGVTTVQNMAGNQSPAVTVGAFRAANLPMRVRLIRWSIPDSLGRNEREWDTVRTRVAPRVVVSGRKWVVDATPVERFALRRTPYPGRPGWYGRLDFPMDTVRAMLAGALRPGAAQLHLHVVGDSATLLVLDAMESLAPDSVWRAKRLRIEHGPGIDGPAIARARRLGIVIAQPRFESRAPLRSWLAAGIPVAYGSDGLRNPFLHMMWAVTKPARPGEAISREDAVTLFTHGSAFAERAEREKGMLAPGLLADLAVLSQDVFTVPVQALPGTTSVLTIVGGRVVRDVLTRR